MSPAPAEGPALAPAGPLPPWTAKASVDNFGCYAALNVEGAVQRRLADPV